MPDVQDPAPMREGECPYCERRVLVYEDPARCPLCDCPLDDDRMSPFSWPGEGASSGPETEAGSERGPA
jgi:hypothetical protein